MRPLLFQNASLVGSKLISYEYDINIYVIQIDFLANKYALKL